MINLEYKKKIVEMCRIFNEEINKLTNEEVDILILIYDKDESYLSGVGCTKCALERLESRAKEFTHNRTEGTIH